MTDVKKYVQYSIPREDIVYCVDFCGAENSPQLLAVGTDSKCSIYQIKFKV